MKRHFISIGFLMIILISSVGLVLNVHFCDGKVAQVSLLLVNEDDCCAGDSNGCHPQKEDHESCCFDEVFVLYNEQPTYLSTLDLVTLFAPSTHTLNFAYTDVYTHESPPAEKTYALPGKMLRIFYHALTYYG